MKKSLNFVLYAFIALFFYSCGGSDDDPAPIIIDPVVPAPEKKNTIGVTGDIFPTTALFRGRIEQKDGQVEVPGFVYSTSPNPTKNNNPSVDTYTTGTTDYKVTVNGLQPATTYYVRGYIKKSDGTYTYTSETSFKTAGYVGASGAYVGYDKGEYKDGWRYMEIHPQKVYYGTSAQGANWGDLNIYITGTLHDFGKGLENSTIIANNNPGANCAAKVCLDLVRGGVSDWFLPSSEELLTLSKELKKANISLALGGSSIWTSTQKNENSAFDVTFQMNGDIISTDMVKPQNMIVLPVRRY
ncbi:MAG: fibronectin type III domain-containing protein [Chryseobacterium sp.]|jgi:hypothetical protein|uniref:hypothetical protein n=1 Tax=Chryseobacterium sp. TaxID=1871047 RepID=UPI0028280AA1|nr:hypothetical protein [Chryseobacterium sp.]MDR2237581.1 fibronectin type III domain-containing protein [Chryseobacterium sp.]